MNLNNMETWITLDQAHAEWKNINIFWPSFVPKKFKEFQQYIDHLKSKGYRIL